MVLFWAPDTQELFLFIYLIYIFLIFQVCKNETVFTLINTRYSKKCIMLQFVQLFNNYIKPKKELSISLNPSVKMSISTNPSVEMTIKVCKFNKLLSKWLLVHCH